MGVSRRVGAWHRQWVQLPDTAKEAHASSQSAGLPEATGARRAWEGSCRHLSELWFYFFLQPISQFPEEEDAVSVTCFNSKQTLVP